MTTFQSSLKEDSSLKKTERTFDKKIHGDSMTCTVGKASVATILNRVFHNTGTTTVNTDHQPQRRTQGI